MGEDLESQYTERPSPAPDVPPYGPPRPGVQAMVLIAVGVVLALGAGVVAFVATREPPAPTAQVTPTPVPVPTVPVPVSTAPEIAGPTSTDPFGPLPTATTPMAQAPPGGHAPPPTPTAAPTPTSDLVLTPGNPAGSGCTPGPGASLPDGQWAGYVVQHDASVMQFDLACFNSTTGVVSNDNPALREVRLAPDASVMCGTLACDLTHIRASTLTAIEVVGGVAQRVRAGVGTSRPATPSPSPTDTG